jgi:hypothetical protein
MASSRAASPGRFRVYFIREETAPEHPEEFREFRELRDAMSFADASTGRSVATSIYDDQGICIASMGPPDLIEELGVH